jgi:hypothetical protein
MWTARVAPSKSGDQDSRIANRALITGIEPAIRSAAIGSAKAPARVVGR